MAKQFGTYKIYDCNVIVLFLIVYSTFSCTALCMDKSYKNTHMLLKLLKGYSLEADSETKEKAEKSIIRLIRNGADVNAVNGAQVSSFELALKSKIPNHILIHFINAGAFVNARNKQKKTPLFYALKHKNHELLQALVNHGADLNKRIDRYKWIPLMYAADKNDINAMKILTEGGADTAHCNKQVGNAHEFALHKIVDSAYGSQNIVYLSQGSEQDIIFLINYSKDIDQFSYYSNLCKEKMTLPCLALETRSNNLLTACIRKNSNINKPSPLFNTTPLHIAAYLKNSTATELLIRAGADLNAQTKKISENLEAATPLYYAFCKNKTTEQLTVIKLLLAAGADPFIKTKHNGQWLTPYEVAIEQNNDDAAQLLFDDKEEGTTGFRTILKHAAREKLGHRSLFFGVLNRSAGITPLAHKKKSEIKTINNYESSN